MIDAPPTKVHYITLMAMENTSLGFACIQGSTLCTWSMKLDTEEAKEWVQNRVVELDKTIPVANPGGQRLVVGFAEGVGVIFVRSAVGLFTVKLNSGQVKKVDGPGVYFSVLPYMSFYTPGGTLKGGVNMEGIKYYNNLINELLSKGVQPFATLFHWDSPQTLEDKYGGFLNPNIINDFKDYAEVCFREFGDRVKHWITFNEPTTFCVGGYASGTSAPGRCSPWERGKCSAGDSGREPYTAGHHLLLAHATAVKLYKEKYQVVQKGEIGITLVSSWYVPLSSSNSDSIAVIRAVDFHLGWFMDPLARGDYPPSMRGLVGNRLPQFTKEQSELLKGAFDFIGLNYYTSSYAGNLPPSNSLMKSYSTDARVNLTSVRNGVAIGPRAASPWLYVYPQGLRELLLFVKDNYGNPTIYITENGVDESNNKSLPLHEGLKDNARIEYHHKHLLALMSAIRDGANAKGYFAWSLLDNFEWSSGYTVRFGLNFVDYDDGLKRYPKLSAHWFKKFLKR